MCATHRHAMLTSCKSKIRLDQWYLVLSLSSTLKISLELDSECQILA